MEQKRWETDAFKKYAKQYQKNVMKSIPVRLNVNTDKDILDWLDQQENKRQYIISLIREDILKKQGKD